MINFEFVSNNPRYRADRCSSCRLPAAHCICNQTPCIKSRHRFWILIHPNELQKPTNTAVLIRRTFHESRLIPWQRSDFSPLIELAQRQGVQPLLAFPGDTGNAGHQRERWDDAEGATFLLLDGTWRQARRMFRKNAWIRSLPLVSLRPTGLSQYPLRRQSHPHHLSTVETAVALLREFQDQSAAVELAGYVALFNQAYLASKAPRGSGCIPG